MKVLIDTNVILDVLLNRPAFSANSKAVFDLAEQKRIKGYISASAITDIFYIVNRELKDNQIVYQAIEQLAALFSIASVSKTTIIDALALRWKDFEDAVQFMTASENDIECIVTRNEADYQTSGISCLNPVDFILHFRKKETAEKG